MGTFVPPQPRSPGRPPFDAELSLRIPAGRCSARPATPCAARPTLRHDLMQSSSCWPRAGLDAVRHARAESVGSAASLDTGAVRVEVSDDGPGFGGSPLPLTPRASRWGLYIVDSWPAVGDDRGPGQPHLVEWTAPGPRASPSTAESASDGLEPGPPA